MPNVQYCPALAIVSPICDYIAGQCLVCSLFILFIQNPVMRLAWEPICYHITLSLLCIYICCCDGYHNLV